MKENKMENGKQRRKTESVTTDVKYADGEMGLTCFQEVLSSVRHCVGVLSAGINVHATSLASILLHVSQPERTTFHRTDRIQAPRLRCLACAKNTVLISEK